jgi:hypothetical protein
VPSFFPAPSVTAIEALIAGLIPAGSRVARGQVDDPERNAPGVFAEYVTEHDELAAVAFADVGAVDVVGGAIKGIDVAAVAEASEHAQVLDDAVEGFQELATLFASCLNTDFTEHVRLRDVHKAPGVLSDEIKDLWREPKGRRAYRFEVPEFGAGNVILYLA